jgi:hypothetical protein
MHVLVRTDRRFRVDRGLAVVLTIMAGAALAVVEACNTIDDLPPYSTSRGSLTPILGGTTDGGTTVTDSGSSDAGATDAATDADTGVDAEVSDAATTEDGSTRLDAAFQAMTTDGG